jgi:hypothetical protein
MGRSITVMGCRPARRIRTGAIHGCKQVRRGPHELGGDPHVVRIHRKDARTKDAKACDLCIRRLLDDRAAQSRLLRRDRPQHALGAGVYLDVVPIIGSTEVDYAVEMRRLPEECTLTSMAPRLDTRTIQRVGQQIRQVPWDACAPPRGSPPDGGQKAHCRQPRRAVCLGGSAISTVQPRRRGDCPGAGQSRTRARRTVWNRSGATRRPLCGARL